MSDFISLVDGYGEGSILTSALTSGDTDKDNRPERKLAPQPLAGLDMAPNKLIAPHRSLN